MTAEIDWKSLSELNSDLASKPAYKTALAMRRGTYNVRIIDKDTGAVLYPSVPAHSALETIRTLNSR